MTGETCELHRDGRGVCGRPAVGRFLAGWRCAEDAPPQPAPPPGWPETRTPRPVREYGTKTDDPLGRKFYPDQRGKVPTAGIPSHPCPQGCDKPKGHKIKPGDAANHPDWKPT